MKTPDELTALFRARGLKVTPQRQCIFRILHDSGVHPTAESVHAAAVAEMPTMSLRTVYQTLNDLVAMGELTMLQLGTGSTRFDPNLAHHHHLVCKSCGEVHDLELDFPDVKLPLDVRKGFQVHDTEVVVRGLCAACAAKAGTSGIGTTETASA